MESETSRRIFDSLESGMLWFDAELRIVDANRAAREALGIDEGAFGARIDDLGWAQSDEQGQAMAREARPLWRAINGNGETTTGTVVVQAPRGQRWLRVRAVPVADVGQGRGRGAIVSFTDYTHERHASRSLQESEQLLRMFGDHSLDLMWIVDPRAQKLLYMNSAYERIWGRPAAPLYDDLAHWLDGVDPADRQRVADAAQHADAAGMYQTEYRVHRPDGRLVWIRGRGFPLFDADGRMRYMAGFAEDITLERTHREAQVQLETERRRAEQEIRLLNAELERRVADRTSELEAKHREMESFTYSVSHDLKAPLRGIDGYSRLLESDHAGRLDEEGRFFVAMIRKATAHMGDLIDDLLAYSRVERGRPRLGPVEPAPVVATVVDGAAAETAAGEVALTRSVEPGLVAVGERDGLVLALRNLLDNALKFTAGRPGREIEVGVRRADGRALFWVRDNGPGFNMRYHDRIFEIFQRLHRAEEFPGTGVGLAIVRKAVERMHGRVWAESAMGQGATFYIELPAVEQAPDV